jgi:hypothetical protein
LLDNEKTNRHALLRAAFDAQVDKLCAENPEMDREEIEKLFLAFWLNSLGASNAGQ